MTDTFTDAEIETLRKGATGAGLLVSVSDRSFFDSFKEAGTLAKHLVAARGNSQSPLLQKVAEGQGLGFGVTANPSEVEAGTIEALHDAVSLLEQKAPDELAAYRAFVLDLARSVAAAAPGGDETESVAIAKIETALGG
jgi:hypothetical protein